MSQNKSSRGPSGHEWELAQHAQDAAMRVIARRINQRREKRGSAGPPEVVTGWSAAPVVILALAFDIARAFFGSFWLYGPALGAALCTAGTDYVTGIEVAGTAGKTVAAVCTGAAAAGGAYFSAALVTFGVFVAFYIGLAGWMTIIFWLLHRNPRIFAWNFMEVGHAIWFAICIFIVEIPIIGCAPIVSAVVYRAYKFQIKMEKKVLEEYNQEQAALANQKRQQQLEEISRVRALRQAQEEQDDLMSQQGEIPEGEPLPA